MRPRCLPLPATLRATISSMFFVNIPPCARIRARRIFCAATASMPAPPSHAAAMPLLLHAPCRLARASAMPRCARQLRFHTHCRRRPDAFGAPRRCARRFNASVTCCHDDGATSIFFVYRRRCRRMIFRGSDIFRPSECAPQPQRADERCAHEMASASDAGTRGTPQRHAAVYAHCLTPQTSFSRCAMRAE